MRTKDQLDLAQLADTYDILGELGGGRGDVQLALARRKSDNRDVLIIAHREPAGDEGNALSHLASDAGLLQGADHPGLVRVLDSHWLDNDVLALVVERVSASSLEERLSKRDEDFSFPRIATVLRDVNSVLGWARERGVVNRAIRPDGVLIADGSDRVKVLFSATALPRNGIPDEQSDAVTVATLARAMLTRNVADPERDRLPLAELRPGLPSRVVQQTEALMGRAESLEPVDVRAYISAIAMSEELKRGEDECDRVTREMSDEQRVTREALAAERRAHEEDMAAQARKFEKEREDGLRAVAKEREEAARAVAREREDGEKTLRQERDRFEREMRKQRALMAKEQARVEREQQSLEKDRLALNRQGEMSVAVPLTIEEKKVPLVLPPIPTLDLGERAGSQPLRPNRGNPSWLARRAADPRWRMGGVAALALLLIVAAAAVATARRGPDRGMAQRAALAPTAPFTVVDSVAGLAVPIDSVDSIVPDLEQGAARPAAFDRPRRPEPARAPVPRETIPVVPDPYTPPPSQPVITPPLLPLPRTDSVRPIDTTRANPFARTDTFLRRDSIIIPRADTMIPARPDSLPAGASR